MDSISHWIERRPGFVLVAGGVVTLMLAFLAAIRVLTYPAIPFEVSRDEAGEIVIAGAVQPAGLATWVDGQGAERYAVDPAWLEHWLEPDVDGSTLRAFVALRDDVAALTREDGMRIRLPDGRTLSAEADMPPWGLRPWSAWINLMSGLVSALAGLWVFSLRPREEAARAFAVTAYAFLAVTYTVAWFETDNPALSGSLFFRMEALNLLGCTAIALGLIWLFARYPLPLLPRWVMAASSVAIMATVIWAVIQPWDRVFTRVTSLHFLSCPIIIGLLFAQAWKTRRDPVMRTVFIWIGSSLSLTIGLVVAGFFLPTLIGLGKVVPFAVYTIPFGFFFLTLAVAVARYRLFDLGGWTSGMLRTVALVLIIVLIDALLALFLGQTLLLSLAMLFVLLAWLPLRGLALARAERRKGRSNAELVKGANQVAFAPSLAGQRAIWRDLLSRHFQPLDIAYQTGARPERVTIGSDGRDLLVPSPLDDKTLRLSFAGGGRRLFSGEDAALAQAMADLVGEIIEARRAYDRGAAAERQRIARDLHDDVGARLMTSLHRPDLGAARTDIRQAMSDMRLIIDGLSGQARYLADALADLRHETVTRLSLAGLAIQWPLGPVADLGEEDEVQIGHALTRTLNSVTRELVTNIIRHAEAENIRIEHIIADGWLTLSIADDGKGFQRPPDLAAGNGLGNARKRAAELGGTLDIIQSDQWTTIALRIPLPSREQGMAAAVGAM